MSPYHAADRSYETTTMFVLDLIYCILKILSAIRRSVYRPEIVFVQFAHRPQETVRYPCD